ncbi:MAG: RagB/SusD family nutrient uptake outer membrane protein [Chitinophagaceae bacterium]
MKKISYITLVFLVAAGCMLSSCKKFLDKRPIDAATDGNFWNNENEANTAIAGAYALLRASLMEKGMAHHYYGDYATDQFLNGRNQEDYASLGNIQWNTFISSTETFRGLIRMRSWDNFYRGIDQANRCIKYIPNIPLEKFTSANKSVVKESMIAEAYFLRAFTYFYMARVWGDVPLVLETVENAAAAENPARNPQAEVLDQCIKDLNIAIPKMIWAPAGPNKGIRASKGTAYALLAHIYAWKGDYAKVIPAADSVLLKGGYTPVSKSSTASINTVYKGNSSEGIFEIAKNSNVEGANGAADVVNGTFAAKTLKTPYLLTVTGAALMPLDVVTLNNLFPDSNDYRRRYGFAFWGTTDPINIKNTGAAIIVYTGANNTSPLILNNEIIFRLQDIQLLKAEAAAATNDFSTARDLLAIVRTGANAQPSTATDAQLFEAVIEERARELFMEGHRFFDLVRLARKTGIIKFNGSSPVIRMTDAEFTAGKYYWPVDALIITLNPNLAQTPFWR